MFGVQDSLDFWAYVRMSFGFVVAWQAAKRCGLEDRIASGSFTIADLDLDPVACQEMLTFWRFRCE